MENGKCKVLVVDDKPSNLELLRQILQSEYELSFATDGVKALKIARKVKPDIILLDIMMPGIDGYETCRRLKIDPETVRIPVIFVTAMGEIESERRGFDVGGVDYITKPISRPIVQARVRTHLALYDQNRMLEKKVIERTKQLQEAFETIKTVSLDTILRLSRAAEYKDDDTGAHILRMSKYSAVISRQMGLDDETVEAVRYAAPMHDIGKIGTPDHILLKPGTLNPEEWEIMKQHTTNGGRILEGSNKGFLKLGEVIAMTHHEKWDGSGYPKGLKGKEIPRVGRIVAIADVFDALTSKRPYKKAFPLQKACSIIKEGRGNHFDPDVVDAFFAVEKEIFALKEVFKKEV